MIKSVYTDSSPVQELLSIQLRDTTTVRTLEIRLWSVEEEDRQCLDQVRPLREDTIHRLFICNPSPSLAVKVEVT